MLEKFYWQELMEELKEEMTVSNPVEKYETEYEGEYNVEDFKPSIEMISKDSEVGLPKHLFRVFQPSFSAGFGPINNKTNSIHFPVTPKISSLCRQPTDLLAT